MLARYLFLHPRYLTLLLLVIALVGASSLRLLARQEDPSIISMGAIVTTLFPGANPARVEALVTRPLEEAIREIAEVDEVSSVSSAGVSSLTIKLQMTLSDDAIERSWSEIRDAIDEAARQFPPGVAAPVFDDDVLVANALILAVRPAPGAEVPLSLLKRVAEDLADHVRNFPGTRLVRSYGEPQEEVRVAIDERALVARGLSLAEVSDALRAADARAASGRASGADADLLIELSGDFATLERVRDVIVRASPDGRAVRVADIARVYKAQLTPAASVALVDGVQGILLGVAMEDGLQVDRWSGDFERLLDRYRARTPAGILIQTCYDQSDYMVARLREVTVNLLVGVTLVIAVLLVTLGWRAALVVAMVLPLCALLSLTVMHYIDLPIHQMSVTGLVVALGLLVDGSIVMTDEVRKRLGRGDAPLSAIGGAVERLRLPLFSSTATTVLAFVPMVLLPGPAGDVLGSIAIAVIVMLSASLLVALVVTPVLAVRLLPAGLTRPERRWWDRGLASGRAGSALSAALTWSLRYPVGASALALVLPVTGFLAFPTLTAQFFPDADRDQLYLQVKLPDGRSLADTLAVVGAMDARLREHALVRRVDWMVGESAPPFYLNMIPDRKGISSWAEALVLSTDAARTDELIRRLQRELDLSFPQARTVVRGLDQGPPVSAPLEIELFGENLDVLRALGEQFRLRMERIASVTHTSTSLVAGAPKLVFTLDEERLRLVQLDLATVSQHLEAALRGRTGGELIEGTERLPVRVRLAEHGWADADQIANLRLPVPASGRDSGQLPALSLAALGYYQLQPARSPIARNNGERLNTVQAYLQRGVLPEEALRVLLADLVTDPVALPAGYRYQIGGDADERADVVAELVAPFGLILALLVATIVITFDSWRLTSVAFGVCTCSLGLSLLALAVFGYPFGLQAMIGVIGSVGVSINAAIIILTALQRDHDARCGDRAAIHDVVMDASRHIVSTTITTVGGFLPLILAGGLFWPPFAMAVAGGVLLSTIVSFFLVPPLFLLLEHSSQSAGDVQRAASS